MNDLRDVSEKTLCLTGRFPAWSNAELEILLRGRGAWRFVGSPSKACAAMVADTPDNRKVAKARELGLPVFFADGLREALGPPLDGYRARFERALGSKLRSSKDAVRAIGAPASEALLSRVEQRIGFPLPAAARALWSQLDGISLLWSTPELQPTTSEPVPWSVACHEDGELWRRLHELRARNPSRFDVGQIAIQPVETIFFTQWDGVMFDSKAWGPKDSLKLGSRKVKAQELFSNLFLFDLFSPYYQAGLWADRERQELQVVYASDYGADWAVAATVPFEVYLEFLLIDYGRTRPIEPSSKVGWPKAFHKVAHLAWSEMTPFRA